LQRNESFLVPPGHGNHEIMLKRLANSFGELAKLQGRLETKFTTSVDE
jgi:hypothetical protein